MSTTATAEPVIASPEATPATPVQMQPTRYPDPGGKGLLASMDEFFDKVDTGPTNVPPSSSIPEPAKPVETPAWEKVKETAPKGKDEPIEVIDEGFFKGEEKEPEVKDPAVFDEAAFDAETEVQSKEMDPKAKAAFKALKAEVKSYKQAAPPAALTKELEELRVKAQETEGLRERIKELSGVSAKVMVENDEQYIKEVRDPWNQTHANLDKISKDYGMDPSILRALVREEDRKVQAEMIKTHLSELDPISRDEVFASVRTVNSLLDKHAGYMENAEKEMGTREAKRIEATEKQLAEHRKAVQTIQKDKWSRWEKAIPGLLDDDGEPTAEYIKMKNESLSLDFSQARPNDIAFAAIAGTLLPHAQKQIIALQRELAEYRANDKRILKAKPDSGSSVTATPSTPQTKKGFLEAFLTADLV